MPIAPTPAVERVIRRVVINPENGCWEWQGALTENGYGIIQMGRGIGTKRTHQVVYEAYVGPIAAGLTMDHLCFNTICCNPSHLEPVTRSENAKRQWAAGRANPMAHNLAKTHCPEGHPYSGENLAVSSGRRACRICTRAHARRRYHERKAATSS